MRGRHLTPNSFNCQSADTGPALLALTSQHGAAAEMPPAPSFMFYQSLTQDQEGDQIVARNLLVQRWQSC